MKAAEALIEAIDEHRSCDDCSGDTEALEDVLRGIRHDEVPGDLADQIEAIAMETLDRIRLAAATTASQAAAAAGIHDYQPPAAEPAALPAGDDAEAHSEAA